MMTEKRFRVHELSKYNYSEIGEYTDENHTDKPLRNDEVVERLNELHEENQTFREALKELKEIGDYQTIRIRELSDENEQLRKDSTVLILANQDYRKENEQLKSDKEHLMGCLIRFFGYDDEDIDYNLNRESNREYGKQYYSMKEETKKELEE